MERIRLEQRGWRALGGALMLVLALAGGCSDSNDDDGTPPEPFDEFGGTPPTAEELASYPKALPASAFADGLGGAALGTAADVPSSFVIDESTLPPVQAQGTATQLGYPGSCEVWSSGYAMGSYTANLTNQNDIKDLANTVSTAYVYMTVLAEGQRSCGEGSNAAATLNYLVENTAPSLASIPYYPVCECPAGSDQCLDAVTLDQGCASNREFCTDLTIGSWSALLEESPKKTLPLIQTWIAQRHIVQMTIVVPYAFGDYTSGVYDAPTSCPSGVDCTQFRGIVCASSSKTQTGCPQHGVAIVGYDDTTQAIKIQNSFGTGWGEQGYMWMSYSTFENIYLSSTIAFAPPASGAATASAAADRGRQWVERDGDEKRVHLVFASTLPEPVRLGDITITAPDGTTMTHDYGGHAFRSGHHYVTRHDGMQFEAGAYAVRLEGTTPAGEARVYASSVTVGLAPGETLPAAPPGGDVTGTNGAPVR